MARACVPISQKNLMQDMVLILEYANEKEFMVDLKLECQIASRATRVCKKS